MLVLAALNDDNLTATTKTDLAILFREVVIKAAITLKIVLFWNN